MKVLRVLVPLDGTDQSAEALSTVRELAGAVEHCSVELLHALAPNGTAAEELAGQKSKAEEFLGRQAKQLAGDDKLDVACSVESGEPADVILERIRTGKFNFVCMTMRSQSRKSSPGSVARRLIRESPTPVIALPANAAG